MDKIFGVFPDGYRLGYKELLELLLPDKNVLSAAMKKLVAEHGGDPKMFWSEGGIEA